MTSSASCARRASLPDRSSNTNGHVDPLHGVDKPPDLVVLHLEPPVARGARIVLAVRPSVGRRLIVVGAPSELHVMRLAMQAGARDLLPLRLSSADLLQAIDGAWRERSRRPDTPGPRSRCSSMRKAAAAPRCSRATWRTCSQGIEKRVALVDLDLQFGAVPLYLDLFPKRGMAQASRISPCSMKWRSRATSRSTLPGSNVLSHAADEPLSRRQSSRAAVGSTARLSRCAVTIT